MAFITTPQVSTRTGIPEATLRYWRYLGTGPDSFKLGRRVLYDEADLDRWIAAARAASQTRSTAGAA